MNKYELIKPYEYALNGRAMYRIRALKSFGDVKEGDLGGFVESEDNLSQKGKCWIYDNAEVYGDAKVSGKAKIKDSSAVYGHATIMDNATICEWAKVYDNATVSGNSCVGDCAMVYEHGNVTGDAKISGNAKVYGNAFIFDHATIMKDARICGTSTINGATTVTDNAIISINEVMGNNKVHRMFIDGMNIIGGNALITDYGDINFFYINTDIITTIAVYRGYDKVRNPIIIVEYGNTIYELEEFKKMAKTSNVFRSKMKYLAFILMIKANFKPITKKEVCVRLLNTVK